MNHKKCIRCGDDMLKHYDWEDWQCRGCGFRINFRLDGWMGWVIQYKTEDGREPWSSVPDGCLLVGRDL